MGLAFSWTPKVWLQSLHPSCLHTNIFSPLPGEPWNISTSWTQLNHVWWVGLDKWKSVEFSMSYLEFALKAPWETSVSDCPSPLSGQQSWGSSRRDCSWVFMPLPAPECPSPSLVREEMYDSVWPSDIFIIQSATAFASQPCSCPETCMYLPYSSVFKCIWLFQLWTLIFLLTDMSLYESSPHRSILEIDCIVWWGMRNLCLRIRVTVRRI